MKISYLCLIVAVVIGLGTVTAAPADDVKAVAADAAKLASLAREAADGGRQMYVMCSPTNCRHCHECDIIWSKKGDTFRGGAQFVPYLNCGSCKDCKEACKSL